MANPAQLLHLQLVQWRPTDSNVDADEQRRAVRHLDAIDELLNQMDASQLRTDNYRRHLPKWVALTLGHPHAWTRHSSYTHVDDHALEMLDMLADRLTTVAPTLAPGGLASIRAKAASAKSLVDEASIDPLLRQHVLQVIAHVFYCIDNYDAVGDFDLEEAVERLIAVMLRTAATLSPEEQSAWKAWMHGFAWPFVVNLAAAIPGTALSQLALGS